MCNMAFLKIICWSRAYVEKRYTLDNNSIVMEYEMKSD